MSGQGREGRGGAVGVYNLFTLTFGTIIGVGWITVLGSWLAQAGAWGAAGAFALGAAAVGVIAVCYAEMAAALPEEGGEARFAERVFGAQAGVMAGWFLAFAFVVVAAFEAISVGWIAAALAPVLRGPALYQTQGAAVYGGELALGLGFMALIAWLNLRGAKTAMRAQDLLTNTLILVCAAFVIAAFAGGEPAHLTSPDAPASAGGALALLATTPFWFAGFNVMAQGVSERSERFPLERLGALMLLVVAGAGVFYVAIILAAAYVAPRAGLLEADLPAAAAFEAAFGGPAWARLALFAGLLGLLTTWNAVMFAGAHVLHALAAKGALPLALARLDPGGAPRAAVLLAAGSAAALTFLGRGAIGPIVNTVGAIFSAMYLMTCVALIVLRRREPELTRPFRVPGGVAFAALGAAIASGLLVLGLAQPGLTASWPKPPMEWVLLIAWALLGAALLRPGAAASRGPLISGEDA